jgi:hypothetical protein
VHNDGTVHITHGGEAAAALGGLAAAGNPAVLGAAIADQTTVATFDESYAQTMQQQFSSADDQQQGNINTGVSLETEQRRTQLVKVMSWVASGMLAHGDTHRRDPQYIADKAFDVVQAIIDKANSVTV